jgi:hypothetical protein
MGSRQVRGHTIIRHYPERDTYAYPSCWTDDKCDEFITHILDLRYHKFKFYLCCSLDVYLKNQNYDGVRWWIYTHESFVRKALCYSVEYIPPHNK